MMPRKAARSAARGMAPSAILASAPVPDQRSKQDRKRGTPIDSALSERQLRAEIRTAILYLEAWLGNGGELTPAIAELAAPAEAARAQIWRWLDREAPFDNGQALTAALLQNSLDREMDSLRHDMGDDAFGTGLFTKAAQLFLDLALAPNFEDFPGTATRFPD
jgi:malate synthase